MKPAAIVLILLQITLAKNIYAQAPYRDIQISFTDNLLNISATNADLKAVFSELAQKTKIKIVFPASMEKTVTIDREGISLQEAIEKLSRGFNHLIVYSGPSKKNAAISEVFVLKKSTRSRLSGSTENRYMRRIKNYERQIESLKTRLSRLDAGSPQAKRYESRISRIEKSIERLQDKL